MRFSVVTVCRDAAHVLPRAMASLAAQTCSDGEWVVIDGASGDGTAELARGFTRLPLQCLSEPDGGIYEAMNKAVALARGDYLYFLNADDRLADAWVLERVHAALDAQRQPDLLVGRVLFASGHGRQLRDYAHLTPRNIVYDSLCHQAVFARRDLFERFGGFDTGYRLAADFDWLVRVVRGGARVHGLALTVAEFAAGGAHQRALQATQREMLRIRRAHVAPGERVWTHALNWLRHSSRRALGLPAAGRLQAPAAGAGDDGLRGR